MDAALSDLAEPFAIQEKSRGSFKVRVFKNNYAYLSQIFECLATYADHELVVHEAVRFTYAQCRAAAASLAKCLSQQHGVQAGDRVGLALPNSPSWMASFIAISSLGAVPALINPRAGREEFQHCLVSTACRLCIHARYDLPKDTPGLDIAELEAVIADDAALLLPETPREPEQEALLMFTSGTTGLPKAASLSHESVLTALKTLQYSGVLIAKRMADAYGVDFDILMRMRPPPTHLLVFPLFHVSGCNATFLSSLLQGGKLVLMTRWDAHHALELIAQEKITSFPAVPTMYRDLLRLKRSQDFDLSSLNNMSVGGQATPPALLADIHQAFPWAVLGSGYGMTEAGGTVTLAVGSEFIDNPHSSGRPVSTIDIEIRDDQGTPAPAGTTGEIHIRGAGLMSGYVGEASPFDAHGWFATGDLGYVDHEGLLYVVDRKTDMVISGGENIYCAEVERVIDLHDDVRESAAFGLPDERLGEKLVAHVVPQLGKALSEETLLAHCVQHLAKHKVPRQICVQTDPLPRNASGKTIKRIIKQHYEASGALTP